MSGDRVAVVAGVADDEVHGWLTESRALAEAAGSEGDMLHATVGFGQLAWLRGDPDGAAEVMAQCLPTLRRLGDRRCSGRALYMLGERAHDEGKLAHAEELLRAAVEDVAAAGQSFELVRAIEALAAVRHTLGQPREAAALLGTAQSVRRSANEHLRPVPPPLEVLQGVLRRELGAAAFDASRHEGERRSALEAVRLDRLNDSDGSVGTGQLSK